MIHDSQIAGYGDDMVKRICSRCQTHNAASSGQFDLLVRSVRLGEDEEYECQVLPGPMAPIKVPLRASVHIEIQGERGRERRRTCSDQNFQRQQKHPSMGCNSGSE